MATEALAMHFSEVHPEEVEVPKCNLCLQVHFFRFHPSDLINYKF